MTEPRSGPANQEGQPGGSGPPADTGQGNIGSGNIGPGDTGRGSTGASASGPGQEAGGATQGEGPLKTRTSAAQPTVPQQYGPQAERGMEAEAGAIPVTGDRMIAAAAGRAWPTVLAGGLGMIAVGVMLLVWPHVSLAIAAILIGAAVLVSGLVKMFEGFTASNQSGGMRAGYIAIGLLAVFAGIYLLRHAALSMFLVAFVTGVYFVAHGIADLGVAVSGNVPSRTLRCVMGVFSIVAGLFMVIWPAISLVLLLTIVAAWLFFYGLVLCGLAYTLQKASKQGGAGAKRGAPSFRRRKLATSAR